ncbi:DUF3830 family protein, partial [bacterium]|nr:DUF3830 family protein [bacterium]
MSRIRIAYIAEQVAVTARLLVYEAPRTCAAVLDMLPVEAEACHGMYSGPEIFFILPRLIDIGMENGTSAVLPGEIGFLTIPPGQYHSYTQGLSEIMWFYGRGACPSMADGPCRVNLFAVMEE